LFAVAALLFEGF